MDKEIKRELANKIEASKPLLFSCLMKMEWYSLTYMVLALS